MSDVPDLTYHSTYRNTPFVVISLLAILAAGAAAAWAAIAFLPTGDLLLPMLEIAALSLVAIVGVSFASLSRHRWAVRDGALQVEETPKLGWLSRPRQVTIPFGDILAVRRVESGFDIMLELETRSGARHRLMQGHFKDISGTLLPDRTGFSKFGNELRKTALAVGASPRFQDGLGFWNRPAGLLVLTFLLCGTLGLSGLILYGMITGAHIPQGAAMQGLALVLLLPLGVAYALYRALVQRNAVLGTFRLQDRIVTKD